MNNKESVHMIRLFTIEHDGQQALSTLSKRQQRIVVSAMNYHALMQPGRTLQYQIYLGESWQYPRLTDYSVLNGELTERAGLTPFIVCTVQSRVQAQSKYSPRFWNESGEVTDTGIRYLLLSDDSATDDDVMLHAASDTLKQRVYKYCELQAPVLFDHVREAIRCKREQLGNKPTVAFNPFDTNVFADIMSPQEKTSCENLQPIAPGTRVPDAKKAVIIGLHWLQAGGAERWAVETIRLAKQAGFLPIVITDRDSHQPWITNDYCDDALVLTMTPPNQERFGDVPLLRSLSEQFDIRGVMIHHCQWLYDHIWWIKRFLPTTPIVDSLHIVEYLNAGGYPHEALTHDRWIDMHHVISPQLEHWLHDVHGIDKEKIIDAPLIGLTADAMLKRAASRVHDSHLSVAFVGRIARQKRPEAFILVAYKLNRQYPGKFRFIMHGEGELDTFVTKLIHRYHLEHVIERRGMDIPVDQTYADADVLLVTSVNEGITLTSIEALSSGVPVLSANVGSQDTIISPEALLPRGTASFVRGATRMLTTLLNHEDQRILLWDQEMEKLQAFATLPSANTLFTRLLKKWSE